MTISTDANPLLPADVRPYWTENGKALRQFSDFCQNDRRIDVLLLPVFDGVTLAKWAPEFAPRKTSSNWLSKLKRWLRLD